MRLPSPVGGVTTDSVGLFNCEATSLATWLIGELNLGVAPQPVKTLSEVLKWLEVSTVRDRYVLVPLGAWSALLTNGPTGTDVGVLPSHAARGLGCPALRAVAAEGSHPATILELFQPDGIPPLLLRRSIASADDGGRWIFEEAGEQLPFEDPSAYRRPRKSERFTPEILSEYLVALGIPEVSDQTWTQVIALEAIRKVPR